MKKFRQSKIMGFLRLYRLDVPVIIFLGTFAGRIMTTGFNIKAVAEALFLALFPYNFVYTLNSITDSLEDSVNKPWRPLTDGTLTKKEACRWLIFITVISTVGIPLLFSGIEIFLAYLVIFLGISYSIPPFILKRRLIVAPFVTAWGVVNPLYITGGTKLFWITTSLFLHAVAVTLLKDLSDVEGDRLAGRSLLTDRCNIGKIITISVFLNILSVTAFLFTNHPEIALLPFVSVFVLIFSYANRKSNFAKIIYNRAIWATAFSAVLVVLYNLFR